MKNLIFVITIMPMLGFGKNLNWSKKWVREFHNKSWTELCKKPSKRMAGVCKTLPKAVLQDKTKFKWKLVSPDTVEVTFKNYPVKIRRAETSSVYLVNRRSLYLEEITGLKGLVKEVQKLLPRDESASVNPWMSSAFADSYPITELGTAISAMILAHREQDICEKAERIVKACKPFDENLMKKIKMLSKEAPEGLESLINHSKQLKAAQEILSFTEHFDALFLAIDEKKVTALNNCECKSGLCEIKEKKTDLGQAFKDCKTNLNAIRELPKSKGLKHLEPLVLAEEIDNVSEAISKLEQRKKPDEGGFIEDSYRGGSKKSRP